MKTRWPWSRARQRRFYFQWRKWMSSSPNGWYTMWLSCHRLRMHLVELCRHVWLCLLCLLQGYFLLFESMLETVLNVRDKWLNNPANGMIQQCCRLNMMWHIRVLSSFTVVLSSQYFPTIAVWVWLPSAVSENGNQKLSIGKTYMVRLLSVSVFYDCACL